MTSKILLIDDIPANYDDKFEAIRAELASKSIDATIIGLSDTSLSEKFESQSDVGDHAEANHAVEDHFAQMLIESPDIKLVIVDRDLSKLTNNLKSESSVTKGCNMAYVPVCGYSRRPDRNSERDTYRKFASFTHSNLIDVKNDSFKCAKEVVNVLSGFLELEVGLKKFSGDFIRKPRNEIISSFFNKKNLSYYFNNYQISPKIDDYVAIEETPEFKVKRVIYLLGLWLYKYVLPQPGILLNKVALSSYVNISKDVIDEHLEKYFKSFKYKGPFSLSQDLWWRYEIVDFLEKQEVDDGVQLLEKDGVIVPQCNCSVDPTLEAGYYCLITGEPISFQKSTSGMSWIQKGADISRVKTEIADELSPVFG